MKIDLRKQQLIKSLVWNIRLNFWKMKVVASYEQVSALASKDDLKKTLDFAREATLL